MTAAAILVLTVVNLAWLEDRWILKYPGLRLIEGAGQHAPLPFGDDVIVVEITPSEYEHLFNSSSPLDPEKLWNAVEKIRGTTTPAVVGVDLDTSNGNYSPILGRIALSRGPAVIWARGLQIQGDARVPSGFLGGNRDEDPLTGIAAFDRDPDATIRSVAQWVSITKEGSRGATEVRMRTFPAAIVAAFDGAAAEGAREVRFVPYQFRVFSLSEAEQAGPGDFAGKIVIVGGAYSDADRHATPGGEMTGLQVVGSAVESLLKAPKESRLREIAINAVVDILLGLVIVLIYRADWFGAPARWVGVVRLGVALAFCAIALFGGGVAAYLAGWPGNPFPVVFGMSLHQMWESAHPGEEEAIP